MEENEEPAPVLKSWRHVYALVIGFLMLVILLLYLLTHYFK